MSVGVKINASKTKFLRTSQDPPHAKIRSRCITSTIWFLSPNQACHRWHQCSCRLRQDAFAINSQKCYGIVATDEVVHVPSPRAPSPYEYTKNPMTKQPKVFDHWCLRYAAKFKCFDCLKRRSESAFYKRWTTLLFSSKTSPTVARPCPPPNLNRSSQKEPTAFILLRFGTLPWWPTAHVGQHLKSGHKSPGTLFNLRSLRLAQLL